jgi:uncharacterized membrane protein
MGEREGAAHGIITADQKSDENKEKVWGKGQKGDPDLQVCVVGEGGGCIVKVHARVFDPNARQGAAQ